MTSDCSEQPNTYIYWTRLAGQDTYFLWQSNDQDRLWSKHGRVPYWTSREEVVLFCTTASIPLNVEEPTCLDLDRIEKRLSGIASAEPTTVLNAWHLFVDVEATVGDDGFRRLDEQQRGLYNRVFFLCRLLPGAPAGDDPEVPPLGHTELEALDRVMTSGLRLLRASLAPAHELEPLGPR